MGKCAKMRTKCARFEKEGFRRCRFFSIQYLVAGGADLFWYWSLFVVELFDIGKRKGACWL